MADEDTAGGAGEESEQQVTFNVKSSSDAKFVLTVPVNTTIGDLKQKLSTEEYASIPAERQRLIYSGRVLKDADTVGAVKIKDGNTVHLVRGAESNQRQNPANQGGAAVVPGAGQPASHVPTNIAAGQGAGNPLAQLTGARYAGFHGLPGADSFGADGGMGAPPNPEQMLQLLDDPNFAQQMNEAMNNPAVIDMLRNNPMIRNNPQMRAVIENPEMRRLMLNPEMIRMQMQMERAMGGGGLGGAGGANSFPMPGATDTTPAPAGGEQPAATGNTGATPANPFAALFPGVAGGAGANTNTGNANPATAANPFGSLFGNPAQSGGQPNPVQQMAQQMMQNPQMMQQMMQMFNGGGGGGGAAGEGGFNPFAAFGGAPESQAPPDNRPPEERYAEQLRQLNDMGFFEFERNVQALRRSGGSVQGAIEYLLTNPS
jgi:ubiquilin